MFGKFGFVVLLLAGFTMSLPHHLGHNWPNFQPMPYPGGQQIGNGNGFGLGRPFPQWPQITQPKPQNPEEQSEQNPEAQDQPSDLENLPYVLPDTPKKLLRNLFNFSSVPACNLSGAPTTQAALTFVPIFCFLGR